MTEFEKKLQNHVKNVKSHITPPFVIEREELKMSEKINVKSILIIAAVICILSTTVFAAINLLGAKEVAETLGNSELAKYFENSTAVSETVSDGDYKATVLGVTRGENLNSFASSSWEIFPERTYAVVAVERTDGTEMTFDDEILVTPLVEGLKPWEYNIFTMNGGYTADIIDGVLYRIVECDNIEVFSERRVYMAVMSGLFIDNKAYTFNDETGEISTNDEYDGTNILIELVLDNLSANAEIVGEYLDKHNEHIKVEIPEKSDDTYIVAKDPEYEVN